MRLSNLNGEKHRFSTPGAKPPNRSISKWNQWGEIDSQNALDGAAKVFDSSPMTLDTPDFYAERCKSEDNLARYYRLQVRPTLFGEISLTRAWGRIGTRGREKVMTFATEEPPRANMRRSSGGSYVGGIGRWGILPDAPPSLRASARQSKCGVSVLDLGSAATCICGMQAPRSKRALLRCARNDGGSVETDSFHAFHHDNTDLFSPLYFTNLLNARNAGSAAVRSHSNATISVVTTVTPAARMRSSAITRLSALREATASATRKTS